jgi:DNA-binding NarL/FixJ family response regulator
VAQAVTAEGGKTGRVLVVGLERALFNRIEPLLGRSLLAVDRVPSGESGVLLSRTAVFDLLVVRHPLPDMALGSFINRVHEPGAPSGAAQILVLADDERLAELRGMLPDGSRSVLSVNEPTKLLQEVASRLLGVAPRISVRVLVRLEFQLAEGVSLVSCQSENISENGMLLRSDKLYPLGTRVRFECSLPSERMPLQGEAEVMRHAVPDVEKVHGMGLRVIFWKNDGQMRVRRFLASRPPA